MSTSPPNSRSAPKFRCDGTFDIECADWDRFRLGVIYSPGETTIEYDADRFVDHLLSRQGHYFAHAGGIYDLLFVAETLRRRGVRFYADLAQHRITRIVTGGMTLRDSYSLLPFSLDELAAMVNERAPALPWKCHCGRDCGGYCKIPTRCDLPFDPDLEDYCVADCRVLYRVIHRLREHCTEHGIDLRGTLGSTAWATARRELELPDADLPWELWRRVRRADKGGRVCVTRPRASGPGAHFDIVNAYPGALARASIPLGRPRELGKEHARGALHRDRPGVYHCTVRVRGDAFIPPLPWRHQNRVQYPLGEFSGSWAYPELVAAIARGAELVNVHSAVIWETEAPLFAGLMHRWYEIRRNVGKDTPLGAWQSRLAKSLTGKFAEQPTRERVAINPAKIRICPRNGRCRIRCSGRCGAMNQLDLFGMVWTVPYFKLAPSGHAHWSAYLRAHTRVQWLEAAERYQIGELCYGDTDSVWSVGNTTPLPISDLLGAWEMKHAWTGLDVRAPKIYRFTDGEGRKIFRGAPGMTEADWRRGKAVIDRGVFTLKQTAHSASGSLFRRKQQTRSIHTQGDIPLWYGDRKLDLQTGITYPVDAREHRERMDPPK